MIQPLCSIAITATSSLLRVVPPLYGASLFRPRLSVACVFSLVITIQVPVFHIKACHVLMPSSYRLPNSQHFQGSFCSFPWIVVESKFWQHLTLSIPRQRFTFVHLHMTYVTILYSLFPYRSLTTALNCSSIRSFDKFSWPILVEGPSFIFDAAFHSTPPPCVPFGTRRFNRFKCVDEVARIVPGYRNIRLGRAFRLW